MSQATSSDRKISSFRVDPAILRNIVAAKDFIENSGLTKHLTEYLHAILDHAHAINESEGGVFKEPVEFTYMELQSYLKEQGISGSSRKPIMRKALSLCEYGLMDSLEQSSEWGGRPPRLYVLKHIHKDSVQTSEQLEIADRIDGRRTTRSKTTKAILKHLEDSDAQLIRHFATARPVTETLWTGVLDRALRFSSTEKVPNNRITNKIRIRRTELIVTAYTSTGPSSELATLADQRVIRAVVTEVAHYIENFVRDYIMEVNQPRQGSFFDEDEDVPPIAPPPGPVDIESDEAGDVSDISTSRSRLDALEASAVERIQNSFFIDVVNIAKRLGFASPSSTSARRSINRRLRRLYDTSFRLLINTKNEKEAIDIMNLFGLEDFVTDFRFLPSLHSQYENDFYAGGDSQQGREVVRPTAEDKGKDLTEQVRDEKLIDPYNEKELGRVRVWRLSLDHHLFRRLLDRETRALYTAHSDIMKEGSGLAQTLYNLWTQTIGRSNRQLKGQKENVFHLPLSDLHNLLWPLRKYQQFQEEIIKLMRRYCKPEEWDTTLSINRASMFGYKHTLQRRGEVLWLHVERDREDALAGDQSYYNRLLEKAEIETSGSE